MMGGGAGIAKMLMGGNFELFQGGAYVDKITARLDSAIASVDSLSMHEVFELSATVQDALSTHLAAREAVHVGVLAVILVTSLLSSR